MVVSSRTTRQLSQNAVTPGSVQGFLRGIPEIHEFKLGSSTVAFPSQFASSKWLQLRYIPLTNTIKPYIISMYGAVYDASAPVASTFYMAIYKANSPLPSDSVDISGTGSEVKLTVTKIAQSDNLATTPVTTVTPSDNDVITPMRFYFSKEPVLTPNNDYYIAIVSAGDGSTLFYAYTEVQTGGWISSGYTYNSTDVFPSDLAGFERTSWMPSIVIHSKRGIKRSGYVL